MDPNVLSLGHGSDSLAALINHTKSIIPNVICQKFSCTMGINFYFYSLLNK